MLSQAYEVDTWKNFIGNWGVSALKGFDGCRFFASWKKIWETPHLVGMIHLAPLWAYQKVLTTAFWIMTILMMLLLKTSLVKPWLLLLCLHLRTMFVTCNVLHTSICQIWTRSYQKLPVRMVLGREFPFLGSKESWPRFLVRSKQDSSPRLTCRLVTLNLSLLELLKLLAKQTLLLHPRRFLSREPRCPVRNCDAALGVHHHAQPCSFVSWSICFWIRAWATNHGR